MCGIIYSMKKGTHHTNESKEKNRLAHVGKVLTLEQKKNVIATNRRINASPEVRQKKRQSCVVFYESLEGEALRNKWSKERGGNQNARGYKHTDDAKARMSLHRLGQQHMLGHHQSDDAKAKVSLATKGKANPMYGKKHSPEICERLSTICRERWDAWSEEQRHEKLVELGKHISPTQPELKIKVILDTSYPNEWEWVGNKATVGNSKPDFKNMVGRKLLILEHGIYWHLWKPQAEHPELELTKEMVEAKDVAFYKSYGYDTLIIWEDELKHPELVKGKIEEFVKAS